MSDVALGLFFSNRTVRVGSSKHSIDPWFKVDATTGLPVGGFIYDFFQALSGICIKFDHIPCYQFEWVPIEDDRYYKGDMSSVNHEYLMNRTIDIAWSFDQMITSAYPDLIITQSVYNQWYVGLIRKFKQSKSAFQIFAPFTRELWLVIMGCVIFGGIVLYLLIYLSTNKEIKCLTPLSYFYHVCAALLGGDEYKLYNIPKVGRVFRLGILFLALVLTAVYTANLVAFLTAPTYVYSGPQSMTDLKSATACVPYRGTPGQYILPDYAKNVIFPPSDLVLSLGYDWSISSLQAGHCDLIIDVEGNVISKALNYCDTLYIPPNIKFGASSIFNVLRKEDSELERDLSLGILALLQKPEYLTLLSNAIGVGKSCSDATVSSSTPAITVSDMLGLFIIFACTGLIALGGALYSRFVKQAPQVDLKYTEVSRKAEQESRDKIDVIHKLLLSKYSIDNYGNNSMLEEDSKTSDTLSIALNYEDVPYVGDRKDVHGRNDYNYNDRYGGKDNFDSKFNQLIFDV